MLEEPNSQHLPITALNICCSDGLCRTTKGTVITLLYSPSNFAGGGAGAKLCLLYRWDPAEALRLIDTERVTFWTGVPTMLQVVPPTVPPTTADYTQAAPCRTLLLNPPVSASCAS